MENMDSKMKDEEIKKNMVHMKETDKTRKKYNRSSKLYDFMEFPIELLKYRHWRKKLFEKIQGPRVLEVGIGTGKNLKYYKKETSGFGIDLSEGMLSKAISAAKERGVNLIQMDVENLGFKDNSFDTVLTSFVFCSVPDPVKGLQEIRRVLKPGGVALFIEHVLPESRFLRWLFNKLNASTVAISGVHINRRTSENIRKAGFELDKDENLFFSIFKFFSTSPLDKIIHFKRTLNKRGNK